MERGKSHTFCVNVRNLTLPPTTVRLLQTSMKKLVSLTFVRVLRYFKNTYGCRRLRTGVQIPPLLCIFLQEVYSRGLNDILPLPLLKLWFSGVKFKMHPTTARHQ